MHQSMDSPPPPAPLPLADSVHTVCAVEVALVPPTPSTKGWVAGSHTDRSDVSSPDPSQPVDPWSPIAAKTVWPWELASSNRVCSALAVVVLSSSSHSPQEV